MKNIFKNGGAILKKKLLIFIPSLAGGGAERTIINIMKYLDKSIFDITLVMVNNYVNNENKHEYLELIPSEVKVKYLNCSLSKYSIAKIIGRLAKIINSENPNLIFSTTMKANIITVLAGKFSKVNAPIIIRESNNRSESKIPRVYKVLTSLLYNRADHVIGLSKGVEEDLIENFQVDKSKTSVIYNPIDIESIYGLKEEKVEDLTLDSEEKLIVSVGRLVKQKDYETLLRAFAIIEKSVKSRLLILGKGPEEENLRLLTESLNLTEKVNYLGFKKNPYKYMQLSDLFILSSKWEGFGHVIVEAMTLGIPVVSTNCKSGPGEIIDRNKFGVLVEVGNYKQMAEKSIDILCNPDKHNILAELGRSRSVDFNAEKIVKEYQNLFTTIMNR